MKIIRTTLRHRLKLNTRYAVDRHTLTFNELMKSAWADSQRRTAEREMLEEANASAST